MIIIFKSVKDGEDVELDLELLDAPESIKKEMKRLHWRDRAIKRLEEKRLKKVIADYEHRAANGEIGTIFDFDEYLETKETQKIVDDALHLLPPNQYDLVDKVFFKGRTITSIAKEEKVSTVAIYNRLQRIFLKLKKILETRAKFRRRDFT